MVVTLHVVIALVSLVLVTYSLFRSSLKQLIVNYTSIIATIVSGVLLVVLEPATMLHACAAGFAYLGIATAASIAVHVRLTRVRSSETRI